jgi:molecular chaperone GrpE
LNYFINNLEIIQTVTIFVLTSTLVFETTMTDKITPKKIKKTASPKKLEKELVEKITTLEAQVLYAKAESENNRKRALEEAEKTRKYAIESFSQEILLVKDSLDAALVIKNATLESYKDGVELTIKQLTTVFEKFNIEELAPKGDTFDPNFHQAMTMIDSDEEPNKILSVFQKGYKLNGRVLRPALVSVSKEKEKKS